MLSPTIDNKKTGNIQNFTKPILLFRPDLILQKKCKNVFSFCENKYIFTQFFNKIIFLNNNFILLLFFAK